MFPSGCSPQLTSLNARVTRAGALLPSVGFHSRAALVSERPISLVLTSSDLPWSQTLPAHLSFPLSFHMSRLPRGRGCALPSAPLTLPLTATPDKGMSSPALAPVSQGPTRTSTRSTGKNSPSRLFVCFDPRLAHSLILPFSPPRWCPHLSPLIEPLSCAHLPHVSPPLPRPSPS